MEKKWVSVLLSKRIKLFEKLFLDIRRPRPDAYGKVFFSVRQAVRRASHRVPAAQAAAETRSGAPENRDEELMLKNIHVTDLKPGMRIVNPGIDGRMRPYLYSGERFVDSENTVRQILAQGYREVYVDLALSDSRVAARYSRETERLLNSSAPLAPAVGPGPQNPRRRRVALKEELRRASRLYDKAAFCARRLMTSVSLGALRADATAEITGELADSLERNPDALLCLASMGQGAPYAYAHCVNAAILLAAFAQEAGLERGVIMAYGLAGLCHDLGKAMLPLPMLNARRKLSPTEHRLVRLHPMLAHEFLSTMPGVGEETVRAALEHHERHDGSGYPRGLSGGEISEIGQLAGMVDFYDALSSRRPYKGPVAPHKVLGIMYRMRGKEFEPLLLEKFVRLLGVYPVGSVVELEDGYRGVVSAGNPANPAKPSVILVLDPQGNSMRRHEFDLAKDVVAGIARCIPAELSGIDPRLTLGL